MAPQVQNNPADLALQQRVDQVQSEINQKVAKVYAYCAGAFALACASAYVFAKIGFAATVMSLYGSLASALCLTAVSIALLMMTIQTPKENSGLKHAFYGFFAVCEGLLISPLVLLNAPAFAAAALTTVAVTGGLGLAAMSLKESFEKYEKILFVALGALAIVALGALFLKAVAAEMARQVLLVGGMALFTAFVIYDTHKARSEALSPNFDPINHSLGIFLDAMNFHVRFWECYNDNKG